MGKNKGGETGEKHIYIEVETKLTAKKKKKEGRKMKKSKKSNEMERQVCSWRELKRREKKRKERKKRRKKKENHKKIEASTDVFIVTMSFQQRSITLFPPLVTLIDTPSARRGINETHLHGNILTPWQGWGSSNSLWRKVDSRSIHRRNETKITWKLGRYSFSTLLLVKNRAIHPV